MTLAAALLIVPLIFMIAFTVYAAVTPAPASDPDETVTYTANGKYSTGSYLQKR